MKLHIIKSREERSDDPSYTKGTMYAVTVRHNPKYKKGTKILYSESEKFDIYVKVQEYLSTFGKLIALEYEYTGGMHFHATILFDKVPWLKNIKMKDIHFNFVKIWYKEGWSSYCNKEAIERAKADIEATELYYINSPTSLMSSPPRGI